MWAAAEGRSNIGIPRAVGKKFVNDEAVKAAGIVFTAPGGKALFVKRAGDGDHPGEWCFPGGRLEPGETFEQAARREALEETGAELFLETGPLDPIDRRTSSEGVDYALFRQPVAETFEPVLNEECVEHAWMPIDNPPQPLHPGCAGVLTKIVMDAAVIAFDRSSVRTYDSFGRLHVAVCNVSKACVNPYLGREIPGWQELGLDPDRVYKLLRDPEELAKAADSFNRLPLMLKHVAVTAQDESSHQPNEVVGALGSHARFVHPYLQNSLVIWGKPGIDAVEAEAQKELSSGYRYRADMTPGSYEGDSYDGVMRDIVGNHVALVKEGRAGPDVVVGDSKEHLKMANIRTTLTGHIALGALAIALPPMIAMDQRVDLGPFLQRLSRKAIKKDRKGLETVLRGALDGKMAKDAEIEDVARLLDSLGGPKGGSTDADPDDDEDNDLEVEPEAAVVVGQGPEEVAVGDPDNDGQVEVTPGPGADPGMMDAIAEFLASKGVDAAIVEELKATLASAAGAAADEPPPFKGMPKPGGKVVKDKSMGKDNHVTRQAMDAAIETAVGAAVKRTREDAARMRDAERAVRPYVGEVTTAFDSADQVYEHALKSLGVDVEGVHPSAFPAILKQMPVPGARPKRPALAADAKTDATGFASRFPGAGRIAIGG